MVDMRGKPFSIFIKKKKISRSDETCFLLNHMDKCRRNAYHSEHKNDSKLQSVTMFIRIVLMKFFWISNCKIFNTI